LAFHVSPMAYQIALLDRSGAVVRVHPHTFDSRDEAELALQLFPPAGLPGALWVVHVTHH